MASNNNRSRAQVLRDQLAELQVQYLQFRKIEELYNVTFDLEMRRLEKQINVCRQAIHAHEAAGAAGVG
ncbi:MAG: hypothetical protein FJZ01_11255 [Candidatus Sericytochromatia bacterium]|nr:hypothetical protein [Candidatus Tanganyikabacteria bacterium]